MQIISTTQIRPQVWKNLLFPIALILTTPTWSCTNDNQVWAVDLDNQVNLAVTVSNITDSTNTETTDDLVHFLPAYPQIQPQINTQDSEYLQQHQQSDSWPQDNVNITISILENTDIKSFEPIQTSTNQPEQQTELADQSEVDQELNLRIRPKQLETTPSPPVEFKPIGFLKANVGYFHSTNIFSNKDNPIKDSLVFSGLTLASAYIPVGSQTYLNASIDGNLIRYIDQSKYGYNRLRFNFGIYQQLSPKMYGELSWRNQQLFYAHNSEFFSAGNLTG